MGTFASRLEIRPWEKQYMKEKSIPEIASDLAKMTIKSMSAKEMKEWAQIFGDEPKGKK